MFITAREISGLRDRHWFAGWDTQASQQLTSSLVHSHIEENLKNIEYPDFFSNLISSIVHVFVFLLLNSLSNAAQSYVLFTIWFVFSIEDDAAHQIGKRENGCW